MFPTTNMMLGQVIGSSSATGRNDILLRVEAPVEAGQAVLHQEGLSTEGSYNAEAEHAGDYRFCLDNTISTWTDKTVCYTANTIQ